MQKDKGRLVIEVDEKAGPKTLAVCLDYLYEVARGSGLMLPAHLIGAAAEACREMLEKEKTRTGASDAVSSHILSEPAPQAFYERPRKLDS